MQDNYPVKQDISGKQQRGRIFLDNGTGAARFISWFAPLPPERRLRIFQRRHAVIRVHPGTRALRGALASGKGKGMSFAQIREAAARVARKRGGR